MKKWYLMGMVCLFIPLTSSQANNKQTKDPSPVRESWRWIWVQTSAPIPSEMNSPTQAKALSRDAAIVMGQNRLLSYIQTKKTRSGLTLAQAQIPSLELQDKVKGMIEGVEVRQTTWSEERCTVKLYLEKKILKKLLKSIKDKPEI